MMICNKNLIQECLNSHPEMDNTRGKSLDELLKVSLPKLPPVKKKPVDKAMAAFIEPRYDNLDTVMEQHYYLMQVEMYIGQLLEYYIAEEIADRDDWAFCPNALMLGTDFIKRNEDGSFYFLDVKARSNSHNSSSERSRKALGVDKWHRFIVDSGNTRWNKFPDSSLGLSEEGFQKFLRSCEEKIS